MRHFCGRDVKPLNHSTSVSVCVLFVFSYDNNDNYNVTLYVELLPHYRAKRGLAITCRLSVRLSVTLVDHDHIG